MLEVVSAASTDVEIKLETHDFGGIAIDKHGEPLPASTLEACKSADAILLGRFQFPGFTLHCLNDGKAPSAVQNGE